MEPGQQQPGDGGGGSDSGSGGWAEIANGLPHPGDEAVEQDDAMVLIDDDGDDDGMMDEVSWSGGSVSGSERWASANEEGREGGMSASGSDSEGGARDEGGGAAHRAASTRTHFDTHVVARHTYLGEVDELEGDGGQLLEEGVRYRVPILPLEGVVVVPGVTLPLRLVHASDRALLAHALAAPPPLSRLLGVVCCHRLLGSQLSICRVGCVVRLRQARTDEAGVGNCLAKAQQRFELQMPSLQRGDLSAAEVLVLPDRPPEPIPREAWEGRAFWPPWAYRPFDAYTLAARARESLRQLAPQVRQLCADPSTYAYWLVASLPLDDVSRQRLLEAHSPAHRLSEAVRLMEGLDSIDCRHCHTQVGRLRDVVSLSDAGPSGCYVNSAGYCHDMLTLRSARHVALEGRPETANSWFPRYAWQIAYCGTCRAHLGWRFSAVVAELRPGSFWGIRRDVIRQPTPQGGEGGDDDGDGLADWDWQ